MIAGLGLATAGGILLALTGRRKERLPTLEPNTRVELRVGTQTYTTLLADADSKCVALVPPLQRGLPLSFEAGTLATLRIATEAGLYEATIQFTGRLTQPRALLQARLVSRWHHLQRRRHERFTLPDEAQVVLRYAGEEWIGWACNVSAGGICLYAPVATPINAIVQLELPCVLKRLCRSCAERTARVVACERAPYRYGYAYRLRLAFADG
ncbi:MAG: PilZ domain-containing protein [Armatimonadota bacterium]|nr:PilZ domain-containing protein [Armatimonadota bacterium]